MEQQKALNALEPFVALSKSATSPRAATDLIAQATSAQGTYVFAELLQTPNIQALRQSPEHAAHLKLLEIFAWGTSADYRATPNLPPLNANQQEKLNLLSLLPILSNTANPSANTRQNTTYAYLQNALALPDTYTLEALLFKALASNIIRGRLDPTHRVVAVTSVSPLRDPPPGSVPTFASTLTEWEARCDSTLSELEAHIAAVRDNARQRGEREKRRQALFEAELELEDSKGKGRGAGKRSAPAVDYAGAEDYDDDVMDVDEGFSGGPAGADRDAKGPLRNAKKMFSKGR